MDSDRIKYLSALSATDDPSLLQKLLNMTIYRDEFGIRLQDSIYVFNGVSVKTNSSSRKVAMDWLNDNYEDIVDSFGGEIAPILASIIIGMYA